SHAALVAREWGIPAVVGAAAATVEPSALVVGDRTLPEGTVVTVDGDNGRLLLGVAAGARTVPADVDTIRRWAAEGQVTPTDGQASPADQAASHIEPAVDLPPLGFRILHALRIKGMITTPAAAAICGCVEDDARSVLDGLTSDGAAQYMEPRQMWLITADGRTAHAPALAEVVGPLDLDAMPYQTFLGLNDEFKQLCTDWQLRGGEPNDHTDADYDAQILDRLVDLDDRAQPIVAAIGDVVGWMGRYGPRLRAARERLVTGDPKALTGVMCDSYHDIWMELHEDLILTQGIDRAAEGST
ncbi:MAG: PEP-utilizing enzyme, partial [Actinomycetota bacterium]